MTTMPDDEVTFSLDLDLDLDLDGFGDTTTAPAAVDPARPGWTEVATLDSTLAPASTPLSSPSVPPPPAPPAPATPPVAAATASPVQQSAPSQLGEAQVEALARDVTNTLAEYDNAVGSADSATIDAAADLLRQIEAAASSGAVDEAQRTALWGDLVRARDAHQRLIDGADRPIAAFNVTTEDLAEGRRLASAFEEAESKARRAMSGPGAFKKFAAARKELALHLGQFGADTIAELEAMASASAGTSPAALEQAAAAVSAAEAAWAAADQAETGGLPATPEMDALRVRAYRLIGAVVDDGELERRLREIVDRRTIVDQLTLRLSRALQALGLPASTDPIPSARAISDELRRQL